MPRPKLEPPSKEERELKPIAVFIIACGGFTEAIYFEKLVSGRDDVRVVPLPPLTSKDSASEANRSSPRQTVERIDKFWEQWDEEENDQQWVVLDVDHHFQGGHVGGTREALDKAQSQKYSVVFSNPCFEVWIVLHHEELLPSSTVTWPNCESLVKHIRIKRGPYSKTKLNIEDYRPHVREAIDRAIRLRDGSQASPPGNPGTEVDFLVTALDVACGDNKIF